MIKSKHTNSELQQSNLPFKLNQYNEDNPFEELEEAYRKIKNNDIKQMKPKYTENNSKSDDQTKIQDTKNDSHVLKLKQPQQTTLVQTFQSIGATIVQNQLNKHVENEKIVNTKRVDQKQEIHQNKFDDMTQNIIQIKANKGVRIIGENGAILSEGQKNKDQKRDQYTQKYTGAVYGEIQRQKYFQSENETIQSQNIGIKIQKVGQNVLNDQNLINDNEMLQRKSSNNQIKTSLTSSSSKQQMFIHNNQLLMSMLS